VPARVLAQGGRFHPPGVPEARARASASGTKQMEERRERPKLGIELVAAGSAPSGAKQTEERRERPKVGACAGGGLPIGSSVAAGVAPRGPASALSYW